MNKFKESELSEINEIMEIYVHLDNEFELLNNKINQLQNKKDKLIDKLNQTKEREDSLIKNLTKKYGFKNIYEEILKEIEYENN